jgi:putative Mg2+ transporter-C (MgtC) family protein
LLRPLVNAIDRIPLSVSWEANYSIIVTTNAKAAADARESAEERLQNANYPIRETKVVYRSDDNVEITTALVSVMVNSAELDAVVARLSKSPSVSHVTWNVSALE